MTAYKDMGSVTAEPKEFPTTQMTQKIPTDKGKEQGVSSNPDEEQKISKLLRDLAGLIREGDVIAMALLVMGLNDSHIEQIKCDYRRDLDRKIAIFMAWRHRSGTRACLEGIRDLFRKAEDEGIHVSADVYKLLDMNSSDPLKLHMKLKLPPVDVPYPIHDISLSPWGYLVSVGLWMESVDVWNLNKSAPNMQKIMNTRGNMTPWSVTSSLDWIFISDGGRNNVHAFRCQDLKRHSIELTFSPRGLCASGNTLWVASNRSSVQQLAISEDGSFTPGREVKLPGHLNDEMWYMATDGLKLAISSLERNKIHVYSIPEFELLLTKKTTIHCKLLQPRGLVIDKDGSLLVANSGAKNIIKLSPKGRTVAYLQLGGEPWALEKMNDELLVAVGNTIQSHCMEKFTPVMRKQVVS